MQDGFYFTDSTLYSSAAVNLVENGEFGESYTRPPVYPVFLAGIYTPFGQKIIAIRIVQAVIGACLAIVIANLAMRIGGPGVGPQGFYGAHTRWGSLSQAWCTQPAW